MKTNVTFIALALTCATGLLAWAGATQLTGNKVSGAQLLQRNVTAPGQAHLVPQRAHSAAARQRSAKKSTPLQNILHHSRSCRLSDGVPAIELLWAAKTESDISIWADAINASLSGRVTFEGTPALVFLGNEGSGILRQTIYVYVGDDKDGWSLQLVCPTGLSKVQWKLNSRTGTLAFSSKDKTVASVSLRA